MKIRYIIGIALLSITTALSAQVNLGTISGTVYQAEDSITVIPFVKVWVNTDAGMRPTKTDEFGKYKIDGLKPGTYNLHIKATNYDSLTIAGIALNPNGIIKVNGYCGNMLPHIVVHVPIIIPGDIPKIEIRTEDIKHSPYNRDPIALISAINSDVKIVEGTNQLIIRGSRPGDAIYYIDGVKAINMASVPGISIGGLEAYTGGIPAKYGDTTGGVVVLETKGYFDLYRAWKYKM